jgi:hypothetical protein
MMLTIDWPTPPELGHILCDDVPSFLVLLLLLLLLLLLTLNEITRRFWEPPKDSDTHNQSDSLHQIVAESRWQFWRHPVP